MAVPLGIGLVDLDAGRKGKKRVYHDGHDLTEDDESLLNQNLADLEGLRRAQDHKKLWRECWFILWRPLVVALAVLFGSIVGSQWPVDKNSICSRHVSHYSPVVEDVSVRWHQVRFNGSLLKVNHYRMDAGPEVDAAWEALGVDYRVALIPADEAAASGLRHDQVRATENHDGGYVAHVEGLYQLHCLNILRQSLHWNFNYYHALGKGAFNNTDENIKHRVTQCLDILRQQLMCSVDTGVLGQVWWNRDHPEAVIDVNTRHSCKNFDAVRKWAEARQMPAEVPPDFLQPPEREDQIYDDLP